MAAPITGHTRETDELPNTQPTVTAPVFATISAIRMTRRTTAATT